MTSRLRPLARALAFVVAVAAFAALPARAQGPTPAAPAPPPAANPKFDAALATKVGADEYGMKNYVLVILKTGPNKVPAGKERDAMFQGHFANIKRLSDEGKLALAGPFDGVDNWRGLFIFAVPEIEAAKQLVATDPVIQSGEMVAEFHKFYGSAALVLIPELHQQVQKKSF